MYACSYIAGPCLARAGVRCEDGHIYGSSGLHPKSWVWIHRFCSDATAPSTCLDIRCSHPLCPLRTVPAGALSHRCVPRHANHFDIQVWQLALSEHVTCSAIAHVHTATQYLDYFCRFNIYCMYVYIAALTMLYIYAT